MAITDKTPLMQLLELRHNKDIDTLLKGPGSEVAALLNIDKSTVSKWRTTRGLHPPAYCENHQLRFDDYCKECWFDTLHLTVEEREKIMKEVNKQANSSKPRSYLDNNYTQRYL
jgi:hypothetical protein